VSARVPIHRRRRLQAGVNLTPMLDVIFNLIFFFILATTIREETFEMSIQLPESSTVTAAAGETIPHVAVSAAGDIFYGDRRVVEEELELEMRALAGEGQRAVLVRGDTAVNLGRVIEVFDICRRAGLVEAQLETRPPAPTSP